LQSKLIQKSFAALRNRLLYQVSVQKLIISCHSPTLIDLIETAQKGSAAYLLKVGSKRRRKQADIHGQNEEVEMVNV